MFEQSFVHVGGAVRKPWSMAVSLGLQIALMGVVVALPLLRTAEILWKPPVPIVMLSRPNRPVPLPAASAAATARVVTRTVFDLRLQAPTHVPDRVARLVDEVPAPAGFDKLFGETSIGGMQLFGGVERALVVAPPAPAVPTPKPVKQEAVRVGGDVQQALLLRQVIPAYPPIARAARISGKVVLAAVIAPDGTVQKLQPISGHPLLLEAALKAVRQWVYKPTHLNGKPVEVITEITVNFTLSQ